MQNNTNCNYLMLLVLFFFASCNKNKVLMNGKEEEVVKVPSFHLSTK